MRSNLAKIHSITALQTERTPTSCAVDMAESFQEQAAEEELEQEQHRRRVLDTKLAVSVRRVTRSGRRADYIDAVNSHLQRLTRIPLPVQCDVNTAQAFRDASREEIMLNGVCFVGDHRTEAFVAAVKRIVSRHVQQPEAYLEVTDRVMRGCSRTLSGSDSYFALHELFSSPDILVRCLYTTPAVNSLHLNGRI